MGNAIRLLEPNVVYSVVQTTVDRTFSFAPNHDPAHPLLARGCPLEALDPDSPTTVMVTHDRNEAIALADRVIVLMNGRISQTGTPGDVFSSPVDEAVAGFVEAGNILHGVVTSQSEGLASIKVEGMQIEATSELTAGTNVTVLLPFDDVTVMLPSIEKTTTSARNRFSGEVMKLFPTGSQVRVTIDCGFPLVALVTRRSAEEMGLKKGTPVYATFKAVSTHVIKRH